VNNWRLPRSVGQAKQSVKLIGVITLIDYPYQVVSNGGTKLAGTATGARLFSFFVEAFCPAAPGSLARSRGN
jgi:hypothetical protein